MSAGRPPELMTKPDFKGRTNLRFGDRKNLKPIDDALGSYEGNRHIEDLRMGFLMRVLEACQHWLAAKGEKIALGNSSTLKRKEVVDDVVRQAAHLLSWFSYQQKKNIFPMRVAPPRRALQPGYSVERTLFTQEKATGRYGPVGRIQPIGGSFAHDVGTKNPGSVGGRNFANFGPADFQALYDLHRSASMQAPRVHMVRKDERLRNNYVAVINGSLFQQGKPLTTSAWGWMYVMDLYGNLLMQDHSRAPMPVFGVPAQYNHSSLNAGKDIICAGTLVATNGILSRITPNSGHYMPTELNLHTCVSFLITEDHVNSATAMVRTIRAGIIYELTMDAFHANMAAPGAIVTEF